MRKDRLIKQTLVGMAILAAGLVLLAALRLPIAVLSFLLTQNPYVLDVLWGTVILGLFLSGIGIEKRKPGLLAAPFIFGALWLCAASIDHWQVSRSIDPNVWSAPISPEAVQRTLIVYGSGSIDRKIIVDGHVDRLVKVAFENTTRKIEAIEELSIASGEACSNKQSSRPLQDSGQSDKCFWWRGLAEVPDGLVIEQTHRAITYNQPGCCTETQARRRVGGKERLLFSWLQGVAYVLPYFPRPSLFRTPKGFFDLGGGLTWPFVYGIENIAPGAMASAIYGAKSLYGEDNGPRAAWPPATGKEPLDQAEALAKLENASQRTVVKELIAAQQKGIVDERSIVIAASLVGHGSDSWAVVSEYAATLTIAD